MRKLCIHVMTQFANCQGSYQENSTSCPSRQIAEIQACNNKAAKRVKRELKSTPSLELSEEDEEVVATSEKEINTKVEEWAKRPGKKSFLELEFENINYI